MPVGIASVSMPAQELVRPVVGKHGKAKAVLFQTRPAVGAGAAGIHHAAHGAEVSDFEFGYAIPHAGNPAHDLMARHTGIHRSGPFAAGGV